MIWVESNRIESNRIESNRIESNRIESNRIESNRIESNQAYTNCIIIHISRLIRIMLHLVQMTSNLEKPAMPHIAQSMPVMVTKNASGCYIAQWLRGRASDSRLREPGFESCVAVLKPWAIVFTLHCSSLLNCITEYLAIDSGGYVYEQPLRINCSIWLDASQWSWDSVWLNRSVKEVKCKALWTVLRTGYCAI